MKTIIADAFVAQLGKRRRMSEAAESIGRAEAGVINQDDEDVGRILRQMVRLDAAFVHGFLQRLARFAGRRRGWERAERSRRSAWHALAVAMNRPR